jgi:hypothetical protein
MELKAGSRLGCPQCSVEVVIVRPPSGDLTLTCDGSELVDVAGERPGAGHSDAAGEGTLVGKRYTDDETGLEVLCSKAGPGSLAADGRALPLKGANPLPSSD